MRGIEFYDRILDMPGPSAIAQLFYAGMFLVVAAVLLLSLGRMRWLARGLGILGVFCFMLAMFLIHEQKVVETKDDHVTVTHWRYSPAMRFQVRVALLGLPAAATFLMMQIYWSMQRRQRSAAPGHIKEGRVRIVKGDLDGALTAFNEVLRTSPYLGEAYFYRGTVHQAQGRNDEALADFDQALRCDPQMAGAYLMRGRLLTERGTLEAAGADLDRYLSMRPSDVEGYLHRGLCRVKEGRDAEAVSDLQRVLKLTNHSDFAEPARAALDALYEKVPSAEETEALSPPDVPIKSVLDGLPKYDEQAEVEAQEKLAGGPANGSESPAASSGRTLPPH
ncbi:tetratricopeptide repeat protein [Paludisphaera mucosa]|uniref:Tetratricopeptide repeat protein n=1 Tax=Paludisphaera mucosa TaxID=3030827 RepID=A0ABT6FGU5_9BACT|nr:tetratricopeptide repeat protein [Paludisphaera mucosa]MDG3006739.1 tetratricopeptide repeat protein [Paludisphaera mucosa]